MKKIIHGFQNVFVLRSVLCIIIAVFVIVVPGGIFHRSPASASACLGTEHVKSVLWLPRDLFARVYWALQQSLKGVRS